MFILCAAPPKMHKKPGDCTCLFEMSKTSWTQTSKNFSAFSVLLCRIFPTGWTERIVIGRKHLFMRQYAGTCRISPPDKVSFANVSQIVFFSRVNFCGVHCVNLNIWNLKIFEVKTECCNAYEMSNTIHLVNGLGAADNSHWECSRKKLFLLLIYLNRVKIISNRPTILLKIQSVRHLIFRCSLWAVPAHESILLCKCKLHISAISEVRESLSLNFLEFLFAGTESELKRKLAIFHGGMKEKPTNSAFLWTENYT